MMKNEIEINSTVQWMLSKLKKDSCLYQDDVVDRLVKSRKEFLLRENPDGNLVLTKYLLSAFKKITVHNVVWVRSGFYWRFRVKEDELGRNARG